MKCLSGSTVVGGMTLLIGLTATWVWAAGPSASDPTLATVLTCKSPYKKKPVPEKTLQALVHSHERWVEYRRNPDAKRLELCQADLSRAALAGANLERAELEGTILRQANLSQITLIQASLSGADLTKTILRDSNLSGADLRRARLTGAILSRAVGDEAALFDAVLIGAKITVSDLDTGLRREAITNANDNLRAQKIARQTADEVRNRSEAALHAAQQRSERTLKVVRKNFATAQKAIEDQTDQLAKLVETVRRQLRPVEEQIQGGIERIAKSLSIATESDLDSLRRKLTSLEKRVAELAKESRAA